MKPINNNLFAYIIIVLAICFSTFLLVIIFSEATFKTYYLTIVCVIVLFSALITIIHFLQLPNLYISDETIIFKKLLGNTVTISVSEVLSLSRDKYGGFPFSISSGGSITYYKIKYRVEGEDYEIKFLDSFSNGGNISKMAEKIKSENPYFIFK